MGRPRKPLWPSGHRGFESHTLRHLTAAPARAPVAPAPCAGRSGRRVVRTPAVLAAHATSCLDAHDGRTDPTRSKAEARPRHRPSRPRLRRPYRGCSSASSSSSSLESVLAPRAALLFQRIIDDAIPDENRAQLHVLAGLVIVAAAVRRRARRSSSGTGRRASARASSSTCASRCSTTCSACRSAFFTRTQTGALISRLNNDVIGAQRAVTGTLGSVVSNVIMLTTTLIAMIVLEWRLTLLALVAAAVVPRPGQAGRAPPAGHHPRGHGPQRRP